MSSTPDHHRKRRDTLELKMDQAVATDEQIRQHLPGLFVPGFYFERILGELKRYSSFSPSDSIKRCLTEEGQGQLEVYTAHLADSALKGLKRHPFEFETRHESEKDEEDEFVQKHEITVTVGNIKELLSAFSEPITDLDTLRQFSVLLHHLRSLVASRTGKLPNFREHIKDIEIEIQVLKGEISDLLEQEKESGLNRTEQTQKEQLEANIDKYHQELAKDKKKLKRQQDRISSYEQKISSISEMLSDFLSQFDPENPQSISEKLNLSMFTKDFDYQPKDPDVHLAVKKVLDVKRRGEYSSYDSAGANRHQWMKRKEALAKWGRRLALPLVILGSTAYLTREQIHEAIYGPQLDAEAFEEAGVRMPTDPEIIHDLLTYNEDLAPLKAKFINAVENHYRYGYQEGDILYKSAKSVLRARSEDEFVQAVAEMTHITWSNDDIKVTIDISRYVKYLKRVFGNDIQFRLDVDTSEAPGMDNKVLRSVNNDSGVFIELEGDAGCDKLSPLVEVELTIDGRTYIKSHSNSLYKHMPHEDCLRYLYDPIEKAEKEAEYIREGYVDNYFDDQIVGGKINTDDPYVLASLHVQQAKLELIKESLLERFKDIFTNEQIQSIGKADKLSVLQGILLNAKALPWYSTEAQEDGQVKITINPDYKEAFRMVFGDDTQVSIGFYGDTSGVLIEGDMGSTVLVAQEASFNIAQLCRSNLLLGPNFYKKGKQGFHEFYSLIDKNDSIYESVSCFGEKATLEEADEFVKLKSKILSHPLVKRYIDKVHRGDLITHSEFLSQFPTIEWLRSHGSLFLIKIINSPEFKADFERIYNAHSKMGLLDEAGKRYSKSAFEKDLKNIQTSLKGSSEDYYVFDLPHKLLAALQAKFGKDIDVGFTGKELFIQKDAQLFHIKKKHFCSTSFEELDLTFLLGFGTSISEGIRLERKITEQDVEGAFFDACMGKGFSVNTEQSEAKREEILSHPLVKNYLDASEMVALRNADSSMDFYRQLYTVAQLLKQAKLRMVKDFEKIVKLHPPFKSGGLPGSNPVFTEAFKKAVTDQFGSESSLSMDPSSISFEARGTVWKGEIKLIIKSPMPGLMASPIIKVPAEFLHSEGGFSDWTVRSKKPKGENTRLDLELYSPEEASKKK